MREKKTENRPFADKSKNYDKVMKKKILLSQFLPFDLLIDRKNRSIDFLFE